VTEFFEVKQHNWAKWNCWWWSACSKHKIQRPASNVDWPSALIQHQCSNLSPQTVHATKYSTHSALQTHHRHSVYTHLMILLHIHLVCCTLLSYAIRQTRNWSQSLSC